MSKNDLKIDWAPHDAALHACTHWHYSKTLPVGKLLKVGAWESGRFIGVVIFSYGANKSLGSPYGLKATQCVELTRVALNKHIVPVSRIMSIAIKFLKIKSPGIRLIVSFADPAAGHHGGIYQATNWIYTGQSKPTFEFQLDGKRLNKRAYTGVSFNKGRAPIPVGAVKVQVPGKHRYLMPLDTEMTQQILSLSKPYPSRPKQATDETIVERQCNADPDAST